VLYHHERMDGTGYPYGLMAEEIPIEARIIGIADTFDALTSARPYRPALRPADACEIMKQFIETQFDQDLLPIFMDIAQRGDLNPILEEAGLEVNPLDTRKEIPEEIIKHLDFFDGNLIG
jgi:HD-GYP domain-containing protein (c-di-GMP phosphodiesterase class II)